MLVNATQMLKDAKAGHYAVGHFNINNLEWTKAILTAAQEMKAPVILGVSMGAAKYMGGYEVVANLVKGLYKSLGITVPVALHLDHGNFEAAKACIAAGFTSVMFDGSSLPFEENIEKTKELVALAHSKGISVEAEVGAIGGTEDGITADGEVADPEECKKIVSLGIDFLAAGIGNIHGIYPKDWKGLHLDVLKKIDEATGGIPLVLHGGTGIPNDQIVAAIKEGVSKINVNTECQLAFAAATIKYCAEGKADPTSANLEKGYDPRKLLKPGYEAIKATVKEKIELFGSEGKAA
ncbi:MAG TPA: fructose-1,6-bisphosphate aldolase, class II [Firmicutes bacterium]|nr:fructose-1,6-bisphosphate aldolase, class II [Bacillota bacterium]